MATRSAMVPGTARLLVIDDEPQNVDLVRTLLRSVDCEVTAAYGGVEGLAAFDAAPPDLVLLDVSMPDMDGIEVVGHIRARSSVGYVPVILVTGHGDPEVRLRGFAAGADEFLEKPLDRALLQVRVGNLLRLRAATQELARESASLASLQREQREMTAFIVHDLRNPIAIAAMNVGFVRSEISEQSSVAQALADAETAIGRLSLMVDDLLMVARLEQAGVQLDHAAVPVSQALREAAEQRMGTVEEKQLSLSLPTGDRWCAGDAAMLRRAFETLVDNAIRRASSGGRVMIAVEQRAGSAHVEIRIADTGPPIAPEQRAVLFEKFARLDHQQAAAFHVGVGLHLCKRAIEAHGGEIHVEECAEWPTEFVLHLPAARPSDSSSASVGATRPSA